MNNIEREKKQKFRTEKVAPEGGFGYLVTFSIALPAVSIKCCEISFKIIILIM